MFFPPTTFIPERWRIAMSRLSKEMGLDESHIERCYAELASSNKVTASPVRIAVATTPDLLKGIPAGVERQVQVYFQDSNPRKICAVVITFPESTSTGLVILNTSLSHIARQIHEKGGRCPLWLPFYRPGAAEPCCGRWIRDFDPTGPSTNQERDEHTKMMRAVRNRRYGRGSSIRMADSPRRTNLKVKWGDDQVKYFTS